MPVYVKLLGPPAIEQGETRFEPSPGKMAALLYYLAYRGEWADRDALIYLFWPDALEHKARRNLSRLLHTIKALPYTSELEVETSRLRWAVATDTQEFKQSQAEERWSEAVRLYRGEFLQDFKVSTIPEFESWLEPERQDLAAAYRHAALIVAQELTVTQRQPQATSLLERLYRGDPFDEDVLRRYLHSLQQSSGSARALEAYGAFRQLLERELGSEPDPATTQLAAQLRGGAVTSPTPVGTAAPQAPHNLPVEPTPFVGREQEMVWLVKTLLDPECRLLTLVGPGGIGKTRLALQAAQELRNAFPDGVWFVSLAYVGSLEAMVYAVAEALNFTFYGAREPTEQLTRHLRDKTLLLVLDNLEHLSADARVISDVLANTRGVKVLATSRERLNLRAEWIIDVPGLHFPTQGETDIADFDATRLFLQGAGRVRPGTLLDETNATAITRICELVQGMPLALELAAGWARVLAPAEIAAELEQGIDFLQTTTRDLPPRHQSIRAVFDYSWALLSPDEQEMLRKLAVFRGGFTKEAAATVVGTSLSTLASLVDKSLLSVASNGRYRRHPLIYQYTREKLAEHPEKVQSEEAHGGYYLNLLERYEQLGDSGSQEQENIRLAWLCAVTGAKVEALRQAGEPLRRYFDHLPRLHEGAELFAQAAVVLRDEDPARRATRGLMLIGQAWFYQRLGRYAEADQLTTQGLELAQPEDYPGVATGLKIRGNIARRTGAYPEAKRSYQEALDLARANQDPALLADGLVELGNLEGYLGNYAEAEQHFQEATALYERQGNRYGVIRASLVNQAWLHLIAGRAQEAEALLEEGLRRARASNYGAFMPHILNHLGRVAYALGEFARAEAYGQEALSAARANGNQTIETAALNALGRVQAALGHYDEVEGYLKESLSLSWPKELPRVLESLTYLAEAYILQGRPEDAAPLLELVLRHPSNEYWLKRVARKLQAALPDQPVSKAQNLEATVTTLLETR